MQKRFITHMEYAGCVVGTHEERQIAGMRV